jgi:hypothetical protein
VRVGSLALSAGVLAGYHFDGNALDFSGNGFNGTWTGSAAYAAGAIAGHMAASLNGASYIDMGLVAAIQDLVQGEFTVSAWVNLASFPQPYNFIAVTGLADGYGFALIVHSDGHLSLTKCGVIDQSLAYPFATGTWYFLTAVQHFSGGAPSYAELFVNGSSIGTFSNTANYDSAAGAHFLVGQSRTNYTHGLIQEVTLYAYAMPSAEISYFWNSGAGRYGIPSSGLLFPSQAPTTAAPAYVKGGIYFDTTLNKLRIGGASGWETVTSS